MDDASSDRLKLLKTVNSHSMYIQAQNSMHWLNQCLLFSISILIFFSLFILQYDNHPIIQNRNPKVRKMEELTGNI